MNVLVWVGVILIGGAGSVLRFLVDGAVSSRTGRAFPYGTLVVNVSGAMILGLITGLALDRIGRAAGRHRRGRAPTPRSPPGCWKPNG